MTANLPGFRVLSGPYSEQEKPMLARVIADMRRGNIPFQVVPMGAGQVELWRSVAGWIEVNEEAEQ